MNKYSKEDLDEFTIIIKSKIKSANVLLHEAKVTLSGSDSNDTVDTSWQNKGIEDCPSYSFKEEATLTAERQEKLIRDLNLALERIREGTYGICIVSGNLIPKERLMVMPTALKIIQLKREEERN